MDIFPHTIASSGDFLAHALAIEREAAARYREFAQQMRDHGNDAIARLFGELSVRESEHAARIERRAAKAAIRLPELDEYAWFGVAAPETAAHEFAFRLMTALDALRIALEAERRAQAFFENIGAMAGDPEVSALATEFAADEARHAAVLAGALNREPDPNIDWEAWFAAGASGRLPPDPSD